MQCTYFIFTLTKTCVLCFMCFYVTLQNRMVKTDYLGLSQLISCIADLIIASEGIVNINT